jgi:hypothetical protein
MRGGNVSRYTIPDFLVVYPHISSDQCRTMIRTERATMDSLKFNPGLIEVGQYSVWQTLVHAG